MTEEEKAVPTILSLPFEILCYVARQLHPRQQCNLRLTCRKLREALDDRMSKLSVTLCPPNHGGQPADAPKQSIFASLFPEKRTWAYFTKKLVVTFPLSTPDGELHTDAPVAPPPPQPTRSDKANNEEDTDTPSQKPCSQQADTMEQQLQSFSSFLLPDLTNVKHLTLLNVPQSCLDFVVNIVSFCKQLTQLKLTREHGSTMPDDCQLWVEVSKLPSLKQLTLKGGVLTNADLDGLQRLTSLNRLRVANIINKPPGLHCLSRLSQLQQLMIEDLQYEDGAIIDEFCGLGHLTSLNSLSFLVVGPLPAEVMSWHTLTQLTRFEVTNHYDENLLSCFAVVLPKLPQLQYLNLSNFELNSALLSAMKSCSCLEVVVVGRFNLSATSFCTALTSVRQLALHFVDDLQSTEVQLVRVFPQLQDLTLASRFIVTEHSAARVPPQLFSAASPQVALTKLSLYDMLLCPDVVTGCPSVTMLSLTGSQQPSAQLLATIQPWRSLCQLTWVNCESVTNAALQQLVLQHPGLQRVELTKCTAVTDVGLTHLADLTQLASVVLQSAPGITWAGLEVLAGCKRLLSVVLGNCPGVRQEDCQRVMQETFRLGFEVVMMD